MTPQPIMAIGNRTTRRYWVGSNRRHDRYNRSLVNRVEDLMDPSFLMNWKTLLEENNRGKRGHPYRTPNAFITFLAELRALYSVPFRSLEGIARVFSRVTGIRSVCYTSIFRRIRKIIPKLPEVNGKPVDCAIDSTGFKITIRGDYLGNKWHKHRRGWSKLHAVISIHDVSVLSLSITDEHVHDAKEGRKMLESVKDRILRIFGDKGYDSVKRLGRSRAIVAIARILAETIWAMLSRRIAFYDEIDVLTEKKIESMRKRFLRPNVSKNVIDTDIVTFPLIDICDTSRMSSGVHPLS